MISAVSPVNRIPPYLKRYTPEKHKEKEWQDYLDSHKITALPPELTVDKPKKKSLAELLSPWLLTVGFVLFVALLNGLIGE